MDTLEDSSVLVTGGAGFIGSHIAEALANRADVRVVDDLSRGTRAHVPEGARLIEGDIRDRSLLREATDGVDVIFHQAGLVSVPQSIERPMDCHDINSTGTLAVLEAARQADSRVVTASSAAIYGQPDSVPVTEDQTKTPRSPYGIGKLSLDHYTRAYADQYDLPAVALRYFNVYGPRQQGGPYSGVIATFRDQAASGGPLTVEGDGHQTRDFVHVDDVVQANLRAAKTDSTGRAINIGSGDSVSIRGLADMVRRIADTETEVKQVAPRSGDIRHSTADISRAQRLLGYEPTVSLQEGLKRLF